MNVTPDLVDAGKRASDAVTLHLVADPEHAVNRWMAFKLADGTSDNVLYDTWAEAVAHQHDERHCCYMIVTPDGITPRAAAIVIGVNRTIPQPYPPSRQDAVWWDRYRTLKNRSN